MKAPIETIKRVGQVGAVMAAGALSLGSTVPGANSALTAHAGTLDPTPIVKQPVAPLVQEEIVVSQPTVQAVAVVTQAVKSNPAGYGGNPGDILSRIRGCESGGNYAAVSRSGKYRGAYQFDHRTWQGVGGSGDPAAASPQEQDQRAQMLYDRRGGNPWPVCSRR